MSVRTGVIPKTSLQKRRARSWSDAGSTAMAMEFSNMMFPRILGWAPVYADPRSVNGPSSELHSAATGGVLHLADELLDDVLEEDHAGRPAVLVEGARDVRAEAAHGREGVFEIGAVEDRHESPHALRRDRVVEL